MAIPSVEPVMQTISPESDKYPRRNMKRRADDEHWGEFQRKQARPCIAGWVRFRSRKQAADYLGIHESTLRTKIARGDDGYYDLYGCACSFEAYLRYRRCTCHDDREG